MSHTTIYFLAQAEGFNEAESKVTDYLEPEHFFDYHTVLPDESGPLAYKRPELLDFIKDWDWQKTAEEFLYLAQKYKEEGNQRIYGHHLVFAGELYSQDLTICTRVFNLDSDNYSVPDEDSGWWVIGVDFHY